jgi:hypothetical protein
MKELCMIGGLGFWVDSGTAVRPKWPLDRVLDTLNCNNLKYLQFTVLIL